MREPTLADLDRHQREHAALRGRLCTCGKICTCGLRHEGESVICNWPVTNQASLIADLRWQITLKDRTIDHLSTENKRMEVELRNFRDALHYREWRSLSERVKSEKSDPWSWTLIGYALGMGTMAMLLWLT